ncbi:hypothetical protein SDC9_123188 [bioreactor metagenome]|uniref:Uncharacterized protein n=1 Tax=bioreactor metagenome TaxID=1076179 RepID=A0A645CGX2_9ZZZZ
MNKTSFLSSAFEVLGTKANKKEIKIIIDNFIFPFFILIHLYVKIS